jgi:hypothetical protein
MKAWDMELKNGTGNGECLAGYHLDTPSILLLPRSLNLQVRQ